jgi:hypothetical protein
MSEAADPTIGQYRAWPRRLADSSGAPGSDLAGRLAGIFEDHDLAGPEDGASGDGLLDAAGRHS